MKSALRIGWILLCLLLALAARSWNLRDVFIEGRIYFVDADCYSRMTRAAMVAEHPGTIIRHHDHENWPQGTKPHTTAPLDYLIVGLKSVFDLGFAVMDRDRTSILHDQTLDLAGAVVSPLLGVAGTLFLGVWLWRFRVRYGGMALLLYAISPILVHGTLLGRPDHQSLLIFLLTVAGGCELALTMSDTAWDKADRQRRAWGLLGGAAWGLSLWVSWYEPLILLMVVAACWGFSNWKALWAPDRRPGAILGLVIVALSVGIEGWRVVVPGAEDRALFAHWARTIGELAHLDLGTSQLFGWLGWTVLATPVLLFMARQKDRRAWPLFALLVLMLAATVWQVRWGYFLALAYVWILPWQMQVLTRSWMAWSVFLISLWPVLKEWDARLFPEELAEDRAVIQRLEIPALRDLVSVTTGENAGAVLGPWWLSPAISYWSHNPCVAGSSHQSLPGIVDSARFFLSPSPEYAAAVLRARRVRWVLVDDPARVVPNSASLLDVSVPDESLAKTLMERPDEAPDFLQEWKGVAATRPDGFRFYRLYRVDDAKLPP